MEQQIKQKELWKESNRAGGAVLLYKSVLNAAVVIVMVIALIMAIVQTDLDAMFPASLDTESAAEQAAMELTEHLLDKTLTATSWGYILAIVLCAIIFLLWKKRDFFTHTMMQRKAAMTGKSFALIFAFFMTCQFLAQISSIGMEALLNQFDISMSGLIESSTANTTDPVMLVYIGILAPIAEEIIFRGIVLRGMQPHGRGIAVFMSAILFGMIHGNPVQIPFAFATGIVLAYVTLEYDIRWAILLHMINNLGLGILLPMAFGSTPETSDLIMWVIIIASTIAAIATVVCKKNKIKEELSVLRTEKWQWKAVMTSPTMLITLITSTFDMLLLIGMMVFMI